MSEDRRLAGYVAVASAAATWGTLPLLVQSTRAPALVLVAMRMGFAALVLAVPVASICGLRVVRGERVRLVLQGLALVANWACFFGALQLLPGATAVLIGYVFPFIVTLLAPRVLGEPFERHVPVLAAVGFGGLALLLGPEVGAGRVLGSVLALGVAATSVVLILQGKRLLARVPPPVIVFWENAVGAALVLPVAMRVAEGAVPVRLGLLIGIVHTAVASVLFFAGFARIPAQEAGVLMYLEPATAVVLTTVASGGRIGWTVAAGGAIVLSAGVALVLLSPSAATGRSTRTAHRAADASVRRPDSRDP